MSFKVTDEGESVTATGFGVVEIVGFALLTVTCSAGALFSLAELLLLSPVYEASHW